MKVSLRRVVDKLPLAIFGFFAGIIFQSFFDFGLASLGLITLLSATCMLLWLMFERERIYVLCAIFFLAMTLGVGRYQWHDTSRHIIPTGNEAIIIDEPLVRDNSTRYVTRVGEAKVLIISRTSPVYKYGDVLAFDGTIATTGDSYLNKDGVYYEMLFPKLEVIESGKGNWLRSKLIGVKGWFSSNIARLISEPESSLAGGLVLGTKESLGKDLLDKFRNAGLIHMVVLSGYNITIIALSIMWLFGKLLSKRASIIAGVTSIILFAMMVGGGATVVRASVMAIIGLFAQASGRSNEVARALVIAALLMVAVNPKLLVFDIGFQLSFLATLGLIYLEPIFKPHFSWLPERIMWLPFREIASATLGAQVAVLPLILYTFGNFSLYAFPVNMLVLPIVPTTMLLVFLVGVLAPIPLLSLLAYPVAWITYALLAYIISLVRLVSHLPFSDLKIESFPLVLTLIMYTLLIWLILKFHSTQPLRDPTPKYLYI